MANPSTIQLGGALLAWSSAVVLLCSIGNVRAGDKIKFSEPDETTLEIPEQARELPSTVEILPQGKGSSSAPVMPVPTIAPILPKDRNKDKNWMFDADGKIDHEAALREIFGIREYGPEAWQKGTKTGLETFLSTTLTSKTNGPVTVDEVFDPTNPNPGLAFRSQSRSEDDSANEDGEPAERPNPELDFRRLLYPHLDPLDKAPELSNRYAFGGLAMNPAFRQPTSAQDQAKAREKEKRAADFQKLIGSTPFVNTTVKELIEGTGSSARQEADPRAGRDPSNRSLSPSTLSDPFARGNGNSRPPMSSTLESFNSRANPANGPVGVTTPLPPSIQPKSVPIEFPKRAF